MNSSLTSTALGGQQTKKHPRQKKIIPTKRCWNPKNPLTPSDFSGWIDGQKIPSTQVIGLDMGKSRILRTYLDPYRNIYLNLKDLCKLVSPLGGYLREPQHATGGNTPVHPLSPPNERNFDTETAGDWGCGVCSRGMFENSWRGIVSKFPCTPPKTKIEHLK